jgi:hypothetical protein
MTEPLPPETLAWLRQTAKFDGGVHAQVLLNLMERVEALEQQPTCKEFLQVPSTPEAAPVATDKELRSVYSCGLGFTSSIRACYDLGRQHGATRRASMDLTRALADLRRPT